MSSENKYLADCDTMRAIGIICVVFGHTLGISESVQYWIYSFHMPLFFFLSGYVLKEGRLQRAFSENIRHYASRLLVPYFGFSMLTYLPWVMVTRFYGADVKLNIHPMRPIIGTFYGIGIDGWLQHNAMLWFLPCLFIVHMLFQMTVSLVAEILVMGTSILLACIGLVLSHFMPFRMPWGIEVALIAMPFYVVGYRFSKFSWVPKHKLLIALMLVALVLAQGLIIDLNGRVDMNFISLGNPFLFYTGAFAGIGVLWSFAQFIPKMNIVRRIADSSMLIFVTHRTLYSVLTAVLMVFIVDMQGFKSSAAGSVAYAGWAVFVGVVFFGYFKKFVPILLGYR
jgi:acyltransferase